MLTAGTPEGEDAIYRAAGFTGPQRLEVSGWVVERTAEEVAASVYALSGSAPHLFADRFGDFDTELRHLLAASPAADSANRPARSACPSGAEALRVRRKDLM